MLLKLQYGPSGWVRLVEVMAITHFIAGVHTNLINEFPFTRTGSFVRFLKWQRINHPQVVAQDEDLEQAIAQLNVREAKQQIW